MNHGSSHATPDIHVHPAQTKNDISHRHWILVKSIVDSLSNGLSKTRKKTKI